MKEKIKMAIVIVYGIVLTIFGWGLAILSVYGAFKLWFD